MMSTYFNRAALRSLLLAFVLLQAGSGVAQEFFSLAVTTASGSSRPTDSLVSTSAERLPFAPMYNATAAAEPMFPSGSVAMAPVAVVPVTVEPRVPASHRFWDRENRALFATVGAFAAADFCSTRANLANGGKELNPVTRVFSGSTPGLAANFAVEAGGVMAVSYLLHKAGHHKLERITSLVNIGSSAGAVGYSLSHR